MLRPSITTLRAKWKPRFAGIALALGSILWVSNGSSLERELKEVSGLVVHGGALCLVGDNGDSARAWFRIDQWDDGPGLHELDVSQAVAVPIENDRATQLEDIAAIGDEIVVLTEDHGRVLHGSRTLVKYPSTFKPQKIDGQDVGVEGLAARPGRGGSSHVAVLFQGWREVPIRIAAHRLLNESLALGWRTEMADVEQIALEQEVLCEHFQQATQQLGDVAPVQFVRAAALEWIRIDDAQAGPWGYLVVMATCHDKQAKTWRPWLQRVAASGELIGEPLSLLGSPPDESRALNWEGLCWQDQTQRRVMLVSDSGKKNRPTFLLSVQLDETW